MNPRIASIENLIARDPGGRNVFTLVVADQLRLAAQSLRLARRVGIASGFYIPQCQAGETDGPPGAKAIGRALESLGVSVDYLTDTWNAPLFRALGIEPRLAWDGYLDHCAPTHLLSIERAGRGADGRYHNMRGEDISATTAPLDGLFLEATHRGLTTIGIGDGGNEIGMGKVFAEAVDSIAHGPDIATTVATDFCVVAGVSNWGAFGLAGALSILVRRDLLPSPLEVVEDLERVVHEGGAVDGVTRRPEVSVDGLDASHSVRMLENIRRQIAPSPFERRESLTVGVLGYGETGQAAVKLLAHRGHRVRISDQRPVTLEPGTVADGVESGRHSIEFLRSCDLVVASPGVRPDAPIRDALHRQAIPVMSELEMAYQLSDRGIIGVTGTVGKRSTVELMARLFAAAGQRLSIGGNKGTPLSALLLDTAATNPLAVAVSSFQLETVVQFCPHIAVLLNLDDAHRDRHSSVAEYLRIKSRVFMNHQGDDVLILPVDDPRLRTLARKHQGRTFFVSSKMEVDRGAWLGGGRVFLNFSGRVEELGPSHPRFPENLLSSLLVCRLSGIASEQLAARLEAEAREEA